MGGHAPCHREFEFRVFTERSDTGGQSRTKCVRDARLWRRLQGERTRGQKTNSPPKHWYYSGTTCALTHPNKTPRPLTDVRPSRWRTRVAACECAHTVWRARCAASRRGAVCAHAEGRRTSSAWRYAETGSGSARRAVTPSRVARYLTWPRARRARWGRRRGSRGHGARARHARRARRCCGRGGSKWGG